MTIAARCVAALCLLVTSSCARPQPLVRAPAAPPLLHAVSWNMDAGRGALRALLDDLAAGQLPGGAAPHVVLMLQEAVGEEVRAIADERGWHRAFSPVLERLPRPRGNALLSTLPLHEVRTIDLPRQRQRRTAVAARVDLAGTPLFVVSAHFENRVSWWRGGLVSDAARGRQAAALIAALPPSGVGIVGGDFNTWLGPSEPAWRLLLERFPDTPGDPFAPTFRDRLVLDHVFFDVPDGWTAERHVAPLRYGSNHHPVVGVVRAP